MQEKPKRAQAKYSDEEVGNALAILKANDNNFSLTARQLNIPRLTLREWAKNSRRDSAEVREARHVKEGSLEQKFERIAHLYADRLTDPTVIEKASPLDAAKVAGIAVDKRQLLTGMPTSISGSVLSEDERRLRLAELLASIESRSRTAGLLPQDIAVSHG